jgi:hypothetical protein
MGRFSYLGLIVWTVAMMFILVWAMRGQTALVYILAPQDAQKVSKAWIQLKVAETEWKLMKTEIGEKYHVNVGQPEWSGGFMFSDDFKAIVPAKAQ